MNKQSNIERYYFKTRNQEPNVECIEPCPILNNGVMVGSVSCQQCKNCIESDADYFGCSWIRCNLLTQSQSTVNK